MIAKVWLLFLAMFYGAAFSACVEKKFFRDAIYCIILTTINLLVSILI